MNYDYSSSTLNILLQLIIPIPRSVKICIIILYNLRYPPCLLDPWKHWNMKVKPHNKLRTSPSI